MSGRRGATKTKIRAKHKKTVTKKKNISGTTLTKTKKVNRGYRGSTMLGHTRTKTKTVSAGRAKRIKRRYSK